MLATRRSESAWLYSTDPRTSVCPLRIRWASGLNPRYLLKSAARAVRVSCWLASRPPLGLSVLGLLVGKKTLCSARRVSSSEVSMEPVR